MASQFISKLENFKDLIPRVLSGILLVALILAALFTGKIAWVGIMTIIACILGFEAFRMIAAENYKLEQAWVFIFVVIGYLAGYYFLQGFGIWLLLIYGFLFCGLSYFVFGLSLKATIWLLGLLNYIGLTCAFSILIYDTLIGKIALLWLLFIVWVSDTGAYLFGRILGGPLLLPKVSPKKTWSGFIGAFICVSLLPFLATFAESEVFADKQKYNIVPIYILLVLCLISQIGDLLQSHMKRIWGVKDMGEILPGHGGLFDRFDSFLFLLFCLQVYEYATGGVLSFLRYAIA